jgi:hypothetical protein
MNESQLVQEPMFLRGVEDNPKASVYRDDMLFALCG